MDNPLSLSEHLDELRTRIIKAAICIFALSFLSYTGIESFLPILIKPVGKLVFITPQEAFVTNIKLAFFAGLFLSLPFILYQVWKFIALGLKPKERRYTLLFGPLSLIFFVMGTSFGYFIILPIGMNFLLGFATELVIPMISISKYVSFMGTLIFAFGIIFETPLIALFLTKIGVVTPKFLSQKRKHAIVLIFIIAALFTPPDVITQVLMAFPLMLLYELGIIFSKLVYRKKALDKEMNSG